MASAVDDDEPVAKRRGRVDSTIKDHDNAIEDHEKRITRLERFKYIVIGGMLVLATMFGSTKLLDLLTVLL